MRGNKTIDCTLFALNDDMHKNIIEHVSNGRFSPFKKLFIPLQKRGVDKIAVEKQ